MRELSLRTRGAANRAMNFHSSDFSYVGKQKVAKLSSGPRKKFRAHGTTKPARRQEFRHHYLLFA
jgi:hypothetical protein